MEKQADSYSWGYMLRKCQRENLRSDSTLPIRSLPHDLVTGGIPHAGFRHVCLVTQSYPTLCDVMHCGLRGFSVLGDSPARIVEWVAMSSSGESSQFRDQTQVSGTAGGFFTD